MLSRILSAAGAATLALSFALLLVSCVSVPNTSLPIFTVDVGRRISGDLRSEIRLDFGLWGYCQSTFTTLDRFSEGCVRGSPGYDPAAILSRFAPNYLPSSMETRGWRDLTPGFALPAVTAALTGVAVLVCVLGVFKRNRVTPLIAAVASALCLVFAAAAVGCVFGTFEKVRRALPTHVLLRTTERNALRYRLSPRYGASAVTLALAGGTLLIATVVMACAWLSSIREGRKEGDKRVSDKRYSYTSDYEGRVSNVDKERQPF